MKIYQGLIKGLKDVKEAYRTHTIMLKKIDHNQNQIVHLLTSHTRFHRGGGVLIVDCINIGTLFCNLYKVTIIPYVRSKIPHSLEPHKKALSETNNWGGRHGMKIPREVIGGQLIWNGRYRSGSTNWCPTPVI